MNKFNDRDISWLSFNERVLQEAEDDSNPLMERLNFLAIFSSNIEEFYKVRVARQRHFAYAKINEANKFGYRPTEILKTIYKTVDKQQKRFGKIYYKSILPALDQNGYTIVQGLKAADLIEKAFYFYQQIKEHVQIETISKRKSVFLKNQMNYLFFVTKKRVAYHYHLVEIDHRKLERFYLLNDTDKTYIFLVEDVIRAGLMRQFGEEFIEAYAIKLSRDAELYLEDEPIEEDFKKKLKKSLKKREKGVPTRLLFDELIPYRFLNDLMDKTKSDKEALIPGGRYHRFYDFFGFPRLYEPDFYFPPAEKLPSKSLDNDKSLIEQIRQDDIFLAFPYQDYQIIVDVLKEASQNKKVKKIQITLYRVASNSLICTYLEDAVKNGKEVIVYTELKARFDEESNLYWNTRLANAGAQIFEEVANLKTHAKIFQIDIEEDGKIQKIAHLGTGNFNEKTANIYTDFSLLTADESINEEVSQVFHFLTGQTSRLETQVLLTSPNCLRTQVVEMIDHEIKQAELGKEARIILKLNSLEDTKLIEKLYEASNAGVIVDLIIRGICCIKAGVEGLSENIRVISLVGRYLEHARVYYFHNGGEYKLYCSSADFMGRNLDKRVEVGFPITKTAHRQFLVAYLEQQLADTVKARKLNHKLKNEYVQSDRKLNAQEAIRDLIDLYRL